MAFPTGYTKYQEVTIDSTKVLSDLTDYPIYIDLAELSKAGADIFDTCRTDGGDIRITKSDGTTELPREIVDIDTTAKTGTIFVKFTGTLSSSSDTTIRIYYNGTDTEPAASSTYGSENTWDSNYEAVLHLNEAVNTDTDGYADSTSHANHGTGTSMAEAARAGKLAGSNGASFDGNNDYITIPYAAGLQPANLTYQMLMYHDTLGTNDVFWDNSSAYGRYQFSSSTKKYSNSGATEAVARSASTWYISTCTVVDSSNAEEVFHSGASKATASNAITAGTGDIRLGLYISGSSLGLDGIMQEMRISSVVRADDWINTEYANMNSPSTFYSTGDEQSSGGVTVNPSTQVATFSIPTYSVGGGATVSPAAQVATLSIPTYSVSVQEQVTVSPSAQVATFTVPAYAVVAGGVLFSPAAQVATFSIPTHSVSAQEQVTVTPAAQVATLSIPTYIVTSEMSVVISAAVQVLTFSLPTLAKVGGVWSKVARATDSTWSRISRNSQ